MSARGSVRVDLDSPDRLYYRTVGILFGEDRKLAEMYETVLGAYILKKAEITEEAGTLKKWLNDPFKA